MASSRLHRRANAASDEVANVKIVLVGHTGVGKTSLVTRFIRGTFSPYVESNVAGSFQTSEQHVGGRRLRFNIWDTAGQERYRALTPMYFRNSNAVVLVVSLTSQESLDQAKHWLEEVRKYTPPGILIVLAANKVDDEANREVDIEAARCFSDEIGAPMVLTSAKTGQGVPEIFEAIAKDPSVAAAAVSGADDLPSSVAALNLDGSDLFAPPAPRGKKKCCG